MAGTIVADTLTHSTAGSITTNYVVNGSAKAWVNFTQVSTQTVRGSLNISSITDAGTGRTYPISFSSSMSDSNYAGSLFQNSAVNTGYADFDNNYTGGLGTRITTSCGIRAFGSSGDIDSSICDLIIHGDLA